MIKSLRESKAKLSELVERASQGEEIIITVRGKPKARLVRAGPPVGEAEMENWVNTLKNLQQQYSTGCNTLSTEEIVSQDREDRF